jgi:hypothetical protein
MGGQPSQKWARIPSFRFSSLSHATRLDSRAEQSAPQDRHSSLGGEISIGPNRRQGEVRDGSVDLDPKDRLRCALCLLDCLAEAGSMDPNGIVSVGSLLAVWNEWEIRILVVTSLAVQVFLLFFAGIRKRNVSAVLSLLLWLAYLLADSIAIYALGYLSQTRVPKGVDPLSFKRTHRIQALWAPFLLLHLGGQDTITAFSIEDNELWKRHLLSLLSQVQYFSSCAL